MDNRDPGREGWASRNDRQRLAQWRPTAAVGCPGSSRVAPGLGPQALPTMLYRSTDCLRRWRCRGEPDP